MFSQSAARETLTRLTRLAQRQPENGKWLAEALRGRLEAVAEAALEVAVETGDPIGLQLAESLSRQGSIEVLTRIQDLCDEDRYLFSIPLREVARVATEAKLAVLRQRWESLAEEERLDYVIAANNLGLRLRYLGRSEEGLGPLQEAVAVCRDLAKEEGGRFLPELARTLNNLSIVLGDIERMEEAVQALEEALTILRNLSSTSNLEHEEDLARTLTNLGAKLSAVGRREESSRATEEAVTYLRRIAWQKPDPLLSFLALSLSHLGNNLSYAGRREEALQVSQESVEILRLLVEERPDAFRPDLARSLYNLGRRFRELDRLQEVVETSREAFNLRKELVHGRPQVFLQDFSRSLKGLVRQMKESGELDQARQVVQEGARVLINLIPDPGQALEGVVAVAVNDYLTACQLVGEAPDELLQLTAKAGIAEDGSGTVGHRGTAGPPGQST